MPSKLNSVPHCVKSFSYLPAFAGYSICSADRSSRTLAQTVCQFATRPKDTQDPLAGAGPAAVALSDFWPPGQSFKIKHIASYWAALAIARPSPNT